MTTKFWLGTGGCEKGLTAEELVRWEESLSPDHEGERATREKLVDIFEMARVELNRERRECLEDHR